jgi:poly(3-hydroxybutyrate) depolymerase
MGDDPPHRTLAKGCDSSTCLDDASFITQLVQELMGRLCVERRRIHATGFSNGAMMVRLTSPCSFATHFLIQL